MKQLLYKTFIGDRDFYRMVMRVALPVMVQNGITNLVGLLDNIMVGKVGTEQASGVSIVSKLLFVYLLCLFGGNAGSGIFTAQYFGQGNEEGIQHTMRYKFWLSLAITLLAIGVFLLFGQNLIQAYLKGSADCGDPALALEYGWQYLLVMLIGLPGLMIAMAYASTLRECGETALPMQAGLIAVAVNLGLNYLLIYGKCGFPKLGVVGAAVATVLSRYVEAGIVIIRSHRNKKAYPYLVGLFRTLLVPKELLFMYFRKGFPLLANETMWSGGVAVLNYYYSTRGLSVVMGMSIADAVNNVFNVAFIAMGDAIAILVGQQLGAGKNREAKDTDNKLIVFSVFCSIITALMMAAVAPFFPKIYETTELARQTATKIMLVQALFMPQQAFMHASYFTLRSGGKTLVTMLFDSVFVWVISVPIAYALAKFTNLSAIWMLVFVFTSDFIKCIIGFVMVKKNVWIQNIVEKQGYKETKKS